LNRRLPLSIASVFVVLQCFALIAIVRTPHTAAQTLRATAQRPVALDRRAAAWVCAMHPDVTSSEPGRCRKCNMALILGEPFEMQDYALELGTVPRVITPGVPFQLRLRIRHPRTGRVTGSFETVHDKGFHLFIIKQNATAFQHLHPDLTADGWWQVEVTLPADGYYRVISDFVPTGGSPQFLTRTIVTPGYAGDMASETSRFESDTALTKVADSIEATLSMEPQQPVVGEHGHLRFTLRDAHTKMPVHDLQPYLGAFGHALIVKDDLSEAVHSHPSPGPETDISSGAGGPNVTFEGYLPQPGWYRAWAQFRRRGQLSTFVFTFRVSTLDELRRPR
jgi:hypothetical protein